MEQANSVPIRALLCGVIDKTIEELQLLINEVGLEMVKYKRTKIGTSSYRVQIKILIYHKK